MEQKTFAFFPEAAHGPALNSVGIAQAVERKGHKAVFLSDPAFLDLYRSYGFEAYPVRLSNPSEGESSAKFWEEFINGHVKNFRKTPIEQLDNYVKECWEAIVDSAKHAEQDLPDALSKIHPDVIAIDNTILFPAIKRFGAPWVRIISCSENEIEDDSIPPYLSGLSEHDKEGHRNFRSRFHEVIKPIHDDFNAFLRSVGEEPYPIGQFFEASPFLNLILYPEAVKYKRAKILDPKLFQYLEGCVRQDQPYTLPQFQKNNEGPLLYISFGSLGSGDTELIKRLIDTIGKTRYRALVNVGNYQTEYAALPGNVIVDSWFPQPSVIPQVDVVIHHGGNNSFTECLYFGKPAIIMSYVWDGHDNAMRVQETGHGFRSERYNWTEEELIEKIERCLTDKELAARLSQTSRHMQSHNGQEKAASLLIGLLETVA